MPKASLKIVSDMTKIADAPAIEIRGLSLVFATADTPVIALSNIDLSIRRGEFVSFIGPSGCGKTTLLRLLAGLVRPSAGEISFHDQPISGPSRSRVIVFQDYGRALLPWRKVWANVALALESRGIPKGERRDRAYALLERMGLTAVGEYFPGQLSGGMQQRVQIARALALEPQLLLMDEPFGALDAMTRQGLQDEIARLALEQQITVVFITHDLEEAIYLGDRVVALAANPGRVASMGDVDLPRPRNQLTTREDPRFLAHRHRLFGLLMDH
jgi:NitT/TauT family transport system ATP-binding protein